MRRTGARRASGTSDALKDRVPGPRRPPRNRAVYGGLILAMVLGGFALQSRWMKEVQEKKDIDILPQSLADKVSRWMLEKKGIDPGTLQAGEPGIKKIHCETCLGTGKILGEDGGAAICPVCQGVGFHMIRRFDEADKICPNCAGMGRALLADRSAVGVCPRCDGRGLIHSQAAADATASPP